MKTSKTINGVEVIAREQAIGEHPNPSQNGRLVPFNGVTKVLLADGTEMYECDDKDCDYVAPSVKQVVGHMPKHVDKPPSYYDDETLEKVVRAVLRAQRGPGRDYMERAAVELNKQGLTTYSNTPWNGSNVSSLYHAHKDRFTHVRIRMSQPKPVTEAASTAVLDKPATPTPVKTQQPKTPTPTIERVAVQVADLITETTTLINRTETLQQMALDLKADIVALKNAKTDPEIVAKAQQFDAMMAILHNTKKK